MVMDEVCAVVERCEVCVLVMEGCEVCTGGGGM